MGTNIKITAFFKKPGDTKKQHHNSPPRKFFGDSSTFDGSLPKKTSDGSILSGGSFSKKPFDNLFDLDDSVSEKPFKDPFGLDGPLPKNISDDPFPFNDPPPNKTSDDPFLFGGSLPNKSFETPFLFDDLMPETKFRDPFDYDASAPYKPFEAPSTFDGSLPMMDFDSPFIAPRYPHKKLFPGLEAFNMKSFKAERTLAIQRTDEAIVEVVHDLCNYIDHNSGDVHEGQTNLVQNHGCEVLAARFIKGCPRPLKAVIGKQGGIDYYELANLADDPDCRPDNQACGSYFFGGVPMQPQGTPKPLPAHCGETANAKGMRSRTSDHMNESFRTKTKHPLPVYGAIDDPRYPLKPFALATCKETIRDKYFERFAEAVTRQLLGTNTNIPALTALNSLPSYGILKFIQPIKPYNHSSVLREGNRSDDQSEVLSERQTVTLDKNRERHTENERHRSQRNRDSYVCANCMSTDSPTWHRDKDADEDLGDRVCSRCDSYHSRHGRYPTPEVLRSLDKKAALAAKRANEAASAPSTATKKQRGPPAAKGAATRRTACAIDGCNATDSHKWYYDKSLEAYVCKNCYSFRKRNSRYPDFKSGKDKKRAKKIPRAKKQLEVDESALGSPSDGAPPSSHV